MFSVYEVPTQHGTLQYRRDLFTDISCRISSERIKRGIDQTPSVAYSSEGCPFCPGSLESVTPTFPDGHRIIHGESVTFPNLFPFAAWHTVSVITRAHTVPRFTHEQLRDALVGQVESLLGHPGYPSINWNYLPSAGASIAHPHLQGLVDTVSTERMRRYLDGGLRFKQQHRGNFWKALRAAEKASERYLFGDEILWTANPVPVGEREVLGLLPIARLSEFDPWIPEFAEGILTLLELYRSMGTHAFNLSLFFHEENENADNQAFCSLIARINPNAASLSDSSFMERLHLEPLILTAPEELGAYYRKWRNEASDQE
jgi:UDPglucose--hexose-1-phosphate uridylyltransferase